MQDEASNNNILGLAQPRKEGTTSLMLGGVYVDKETFIQLLSGDQYREEVWHKIINLSKKNVILGEKNSKMKKKILKRKLKRL